jgi:hypothetical protein
MSSYVVLLIQTGVAALAAVAMGCAAADATPSPQPGPNLPIPGASPREDGDGGLAAVDVAAGAAVHVFGSPLCNVSFSSCNPDDPRTARASWCGLAPDGGLYSASAGYDNAQLACHVLPAINQPGVLPACTAAGSLNDTSPTACSAPTDCQAGFECVAGGSCRHYCCAGECFDPTEFCDIQQTAQNSSIPVPVCAPIHSCALLDQASDAGSCAPGQTCSVVRVENGATSCVATGGADAGAECDTEHCAAGLVCLGTAGDRHCYKLCHTAPGSADCPVDRPTCRGGLPLFPLPGIGICQ